MPLRRNITGVSLRGLGKALGVDVIFLLEVWGRKSPKRDDVLNRPYFGDLCRKMGDNMTGSGLSVVFWGGAVVIGHHHFRDTWRPFWLSR